MFPQGKKYKRYLVWGKNRENGGGGRYLLERYGELTELKEIGKNQTLGRTETQAVLGSLGIRK